jgi:hypothetical protein
MPTTGSRRSWAYDRHNIGDTPLDGKPVFAGDPITALHSIKAKALLSSRRRAQRKSRIQAS